MFYRSIGSTKILANVHKGDIIMINELSCLVTSISSDKLSVILLKLHSHMPSIILVA